MNQIPRRVTTQRLLQMKQQGDKVAMLTAYDYTLARLVDAAGIDVVLVGDSASNVMAGYETTLPISLDDMIYHAKSVVKAVKRALVVVDLPFGTYQEDEKQAVRNAIRVMKEAGAHAIKVEGGQEIQPAIKQILSAGIPIMGHLGLMPQSIYKFGTYKVRAQAQDEAKRLILDAQMLEDAGCFAIVLEKIPSALGKQVTEKSNIPIIGIGAGQHTDGQVLVLHDMLGLTQNFEPRFLRRYANLENIIIKAIQQYTKDVKEQKFPREDES